MTETVKEQAVEQVCTDPDDQVDNTDNIDSSEKMVSSTQPPKKNTDDEEEQEQQPKSCIQRIAKRCCDFYWNNEFVCLVVIVILLARAYPPLGAVYLAPKITSTWIAVVFIFVLAGLGLKTEEFSKAFQQFKFNLLVQVFNLGVVSSIVFGVSRGLVSAGIISQGLADGMAVCASLPLTINMVLVLTKSAGGDEAAAIFNAAFGNMIGVFLSPILILAYLGVTGDVDLFTVFYKLVLRVVVPVCIGQILQKTSQVVVDFVKQYKKHFKTAQQYALVFIVYTVFCRTFEGESDSSVPDIFVMIVVQFILLCSLMILAWFTLKLLFPNEPKLRVMGLFGCTHKTVAMGVPLINAIYESNPLVGLYTLPLLIWHPMQLVVGSYLAPRLLAFVESEKQRLGIKDEEDEKPAETVASSTPKTDNAQGSEEPNGANNNDEEAGLSSKNNQVTS